jgi:hypothetical protein
LKDVGVGRRILDAADKGDMQAGLLGNVPTRELQDLAALLNDASKTGGQLVLF